MKISPRTFIDDYITNPLAKELSCKEKVLAVALSILLLIPPFCVLHIRSLILKSKKVTNTPPGYEDFVKGLNDGNAALVSEILSKQSQVEIVKTLSHFLGSIYKEAKRNDKRLQLLLAQLEKRFPEIDFKNHIIFRFDGLILFPDGIKIILEYLKKKGAVDPASNIIVCNSLEELTVEVKKLDFEHDFKAGFLVRGRNMKRPTEQHIIPAYIEHKVGQQPQIFISDSAGREETIYNNVKTTYAHIQTKYIKKGLPQHLTPTVYANGFLRQYNWTACPIFAIRDMVQIMRNPTIMQQVKELAGSGENEVNFMDTLPVALMKPHHGLKVLDKVAESKKGREETVGWDKENQPETLYQNLQKHKQTIVNDKGEKKVVNNSTNQREIKYLNIILSRLLSPC